MTEKKQGAFNEGDLLPCCGVGIFEPAGQVSDEDWRLGLNEECEARYAEDVADVRKSC